MSIDRNLRFALLTCLTACASGMNDAETARQQMLKACHLDNDPTVEHNADVRACEPGNTKKTTICHVPPGNPANAHTLCIGNAAVKHHLANHDDYLGPCRAEPPCSPPDGTAGAGGSSPQGGAGGTPAQGGAGGSPGEGGSGGSPGEGGGGGNGTGGAPNEPPIE